MSIRESKVTSLSEFAISVSSLDEVVYPVTIQCHDVLIHILEVTKVESKRMREYFVTVMFERNGRKTRAFTIPCRDVKDLVTKLRIEVLRYRVFSRLGFLR